MEYWISSIDSQKSPKKAPPPQKKKRLPRDFGHEVDASTNFSSQIPICYIYIYIYIFQLLRLIWPFRGKGGKGLQRSLEVCEFWHQKKNRNWMSTANNTIFFIIFFYQLLMSLYISLLLIILLLLWTKKKKNFFFWWGKKKTFIMH